MPDNSAFGMGGGMFGGGPGMFPGSSVTSPQAFNFAGIPGMGSPLGQMMAGPLQQYMQRVLGPGWLPAQFAPQMNLYDFYRRQDQFLQMQRSIEAAASVDQGTYMQMMRGAAGLGGLDWNADRQRWAQRLTQDFTRISPTLSMAMPELFDRLHGSAGSAQVMARSVFMGGRYSLDPVTGLTGLSPDSVAATTARMRQEYFGPGADLQGMRGLTMGRMGQLYDEMARRGLLRPGNVAVTPGAIQELAIQRLGPDADAGELAAEMHKLSKLKPEEMLPRIQADRVTKQLKGMAGVVAAMQDIFGEMGRTDAPMHEILNGLQQLTQTDLGALDPSRTEKLVRDLSNMARRTGMGMENLSTAIGQAGQIARQMGLEPVFGARAAGSAAAFSHAYGLNEGGLGGWRRAGKEEIFSRATGLELGAANSIAANQMAAVVRMGQAGLFQKGSSGEALYQALLGGQDTFLDPRTGQARGVHVASRDWLGMMQSSGVQLAIAQQYRLQSSANQETIDRFDLGARARVAQTEVAGRLIGTAFGNVGATFRLDRGVRKQIGEIAAQGLLRDLSAEDAADPAKLQSYIADQLKQRGVKMTPQLQKALEQMGSLGLGNLEQIVAMDPRLKQIFGSGRNLVSLNRQENLDRASLLREQVGTESDLQSAMAHLGRSTPLRRVVDLLIQGEGKTSAGAALAQVLGFEKAERVRDALTPTLEGIQKDLKGLEGAQAEAGVQVAELKAMRDEIAREKDPARKRDLEAQLKQRLGELGIRSPKDLDRKQAQIAIARQIRQKALTSIRNRTAEAGKQPGMLAEQASTRQRIEQALDSEGLIRWRRAYAGMSEEERRKFETLPEAEQVRQIEKAVGATPGELSALRRVARELQQNSGKDPEAARTLERINADIGMAARMPASAAALGVLHGMSEEEVRRRYGMAGGPAAVPEDIGKLLDEADRPIYQRVQDARRQRTAAASKLAAKKAEAEQLRKAGKQVPRRLRDDIRFLEQASVGIAEEEKQAMEAARGNKGASAALDEEARQAGLELAGMMTHIGGLRPTTPAKSAADKEKERQTKEQEAKKPQKQEIAGHLTVDFTNLSAFLDGTSAAKN